METISLEQVVAAPVDAVFAWLADARNYAKTPLVLRVRWTRPGDEAPFGVGAVRTVLCPGAWFEELITAYNPPRDFSYHIERSFPAIHHEVGALRFDGVDGDTRVHWTTTFEIRSPVAAPLLTRLVKPVLHHAFRQILTAADKDLSGR
jgi:hypothetical protein